MVIESRGYCPDDDEPAGANIDRVDARTFFASAALLFAHADDILKRAEYFFCPLSLAYCSWPYLGGCGPFRLGHLLVGWRDGQLIDECLYCHGDLLIYFFGGSILSGGNTFTGYCINCGAICRLHHLPIALFVQRMQYAIALRNAFVEEVEEVDEYDGFVFSFGGNGLKPARKTRFSTRRLVEPVSYEKLLSDLQSGMLCPENPPVIQDTLDMKCALRFTRAGTTIRLQPFCSLTD